jgi:hypothetical protein
MPMRSTMRRSSGWSAAAAPIACCRSMAHCTAFTALANSTMMPSPVTLNTRPWCFATSGETISLRRALSVARVPTSSSSVRRL